MPRITSGNRNIDTVKVTFDESWDCENGKFFASFYIDDPDNASVCDLAKEDERCFGCLIPNEMLEKEGSFVFGVWCESGNKTKTSGEITILVHRGAVTSKTGSGGMALTPEIWYERIEESWIA